MAASTLSVPSVDPSSTTTTSTVSGTSAARTRRTISATVVRSLNTGTITDSVRYSTGARERSATVAARRGAVGSRRGPPLCGEVLDRAGQPLAQRRPLGSQPSAGPGAA